MSVEVINFGCRLNVYEGQTIKDQARIAGLENAIVFNSCAVTKEAERQVRQAIRKARKEHPNAKLVVTGCSAQINPKQYLEMDEVDAVLGNEDKLHAENYEKVKELSSLKNTPPACDSSNTTPTACGGGKGGGEHNFSAQFIPLPLSPPVNGGGFYPNGERAIVNDIFSVRETAGHLVSHIEGHSRAFVQVQNGCDHRCTFCIIPFGRGNSRSVPAGEVVSQIRKLVEQGYQEVVLTGVDISDYGKYLPGGITLGKLCQKILKLVPDLPRLRISSIDAVEVDAALLDVIAHEERLMPHLHLSLQAGNDMILKRMKRRHLRKDILEFCAQVRALRPDIVYGADIIAGFPTETEEMFQDTLDLVEKAGLTYLHVFPYSEREGTPAAKMPQVAKQVRKERAARLRDAGLKQEKHFYKSLIGETHKVLVEEKNIGRTPHFAAVKCEGLPAGEIMNMYLTADMLG